MACGDCGERVNDKVAFGFAVIVGLMAAGISHGVTSSSWKNSLVDDPSSIATERSIVLLRREIQNLESW